MSNRHLPVRPDLQQLRHQAKDLLRAIRQEDPSAIEDLRKHSSTAKEPANVKLADAQLGLARSYGVRSWPRLVLACKVIDAIWEDRSEELRELVIKHPRLRDEMARGTDSCNWGPPESYAANLGLRDSNDDTMHEYFNVTPLEWGRQFHDRGFVDAAAMKLIAERGGK